jgi:hypothetical protein
MLFFIWAAIKQPRNGRKTNNKKLKIAISLLEKAESKMA